MLSIASVIESTVQTYLLSRQRRRVNFHTLAIGLSCGLVAGENDGSNPPARATRRFLWIPEC